MFDVGWSELLVIGVVALIAIGPKELPGVLRAVGQWTGKIRRMASEFQDQFREAMREVEMADLKKQIDDTTSELTANLDPMNYDGTAWKPETPAGKAPNTAPNNVANTAESEASGGASEPNPQFLRQNESGSTADPHSVTDAGAPAADPPKTKTAESGA